MAEASIDHSNDHRRAYQTDSQGRFDLDTRAPVLVIRKAGFRSELIRTNEVTEIHVTLQKLSSRTFLACSKTGRFDRIEGWHSLLQFPKMSEIKSTRQTRDVDYGSRWYYVETASGKKGILHGSGPLWSLGIPLDADVWQSDKYEEIGYALGPITILDARGELPDGKRWRYLGLVGESASYSNMDLATANTLDKLLDGACLNWPLHR